MVNIQTATKPRVHLLAQHVWPDDAATGLYAEQLAHSLLERGVRVVLVGGVGRYRESCRPRPEANIVRLDHFCGRRGKLPQVAMEYHSLARAFEGYIQQYVNSGEVVIIGSFPPNTVRLSTAIHERGATAVYWLQDYYPELLRALWEYPAPFRRWFSSRWNRHLTKWDYVIKAAENLGYEGPNARVIRNWPSHDLGEPKPFIPKTALYSGGFGYAHGVSTFVEGCEKLREEGFQITVRGDGPGLPHLPNWINREAPLQNLDELIESYWKAEVHLVAADPRIRTALFPSKFWNSRASGRRLVCTGFEGEMAEELEIARVTDYTAHKQQWVDLIMSLI